MSVNARERELTRECKYEREEENVRETMMVFLVGECL